MKLILLQLFTNLTIGSKVYFDGKVQTVADFILTTPFSKGIIKTGWMQPLHFTLVLKNEWGL
ncbi:MAG: hypothetical protein ACJAVA_000288 [Flavobacteriaceae bacterium]|jgi:hypothetical protein